MTWQPRKNEPCADEIRDKRLCICQQCPFFFSGKCRIASCRWGKPSVQSSSCPLEPPQWTSDDPSQSSDGPGLPPAKLLVIGDDLVPREA